MAFHAAAFNVEGSLHRRIGMVAGGAGSLGVNGVLVHGAAFELEHRLIELLREKSFGTRVMTGGAFPGVRLDVRGVVKGDILRLPLEDQGLGRRLGIGGAQGQSTGE